MDSKLTPLLRERQFLAALLTGLPGIVFAYVTAYAAVMHGDQHGIGSAVAAIAANPLTIYLGMRQIPRAAAISNAAAMASAAEPVADSGIDLTTQDLAEAQEALSVEPPA